MNKENKSGVQHMKDGMMIVLAVCAIVLCIVFMKKKSNTSLILS